MYVHTHRDREGGICLCSQNKYFGIKLMTGNSSANFSTILPLTASRSLSVLSLPWWGKGGQHDFLFHRK